MKPNINKKWILTGRVAFSAAWMILLMVLVIRCRTEQFHNILYVYTNFLSTQKIFLITLEKVILSTILCSFGIACVFFYYITYETKEFLTYTRIFWYAGGVILSVWDYEFVFFSTEKMRWFWRTSSDLSMALLLYTIGKALLDQFSLSNLPRLKKVNKGILTISSIAFLVRDIHISKVVLGLYALSEVLFFSFMLIVLLRKKVWKRTRSIGELLDLVVIGTLFLMPVILLTIISRYKYETLTAGYLFYRDFLPFVFLFYVVILFIRFFQYHRIGFLVGGTANRKINELARHREAITKNILNQCMIPVNNLVAYKKRLQNDTTDVQTIVGSFNDEIDRLKKNMDSIGRYHNLVGQSERVDKIKISVMAVINYTFYLFKKEVNGRYEIEWNNVSENDYVWAEPSMLVHANKIVLAELYNLSNGKNNRLIITRENDSNITVEIQCNVDEKKKKYIKKINRILNGPIYELTTVEDEDLGIYVAKSNLWKHDQGMKSRLSKNEGEYRISIRYGLTGWNDEITQNSLSSSKETDEQNGGKVIVLLSTVSEQIEIIKSYLAMERYTLLHFSNEEDAIKYIGNHNNVGPIIIGTMFFSANIKYFCRRIREKYSLEQLPILLICKDKYKYVDDELIKYMNDIIGEPYEQIDLLQKIKMLILLQESAKETIRAKLDFLQAQMDPHFIFNALSTIMPLCIQNPMVAYQMLSDFSGYLRGRLYTDNLQSCVSISKEIELIQSYLSIEKVRFSEILEYSFDLDVNEEYKILPLLIEPIVENSVKHGIKGKERLRIWIQIREDKQYISITVEDNGNGMSSEMLQRIMTDSEKASTSIGLGNVKKRLAMYYNQKLNIHSAINAGTRVSFKIPKSFLQDGNF